MMNYKHTARCAICLTKDNLGSYIERPFQTVETFNHGIYNCHKCWGEDKLLPIPLCELENDEKV